MTPELRFPGLVHRLVGENVLNVAVTHSADSHHHHHTVTIGANILLHSAHENTNILSSTSHEISAVSDISTEQLLRDRLVIVVGVPCESSWFWESRLRS